MFRTLYHFTSPEQARSICETGAILPISYADIHHCETYERRTLGGTSCSQHGYHGYTPKVLWLTPAERLQDMLTAKAWEEFAEQFAESPWPPGQGPYQRSFRFTVRVPVFTVQLWENFAKLHGAEPEWLDYMRANRADEYVSTAPVRHEQWIQLRDERTGQMWDYHPSRGPAYAANCVQAHMNAPPAVLLTCDSQPDLAECRFSAWPQV